MVKSVYRVGILACIFARLCVLNYFRKPSR